MADNVPIQGIEYEIKGSADAAAKSLLDFAKQIRKLDVADGAAKKIRELGAALKDFEKDAKGLGRLKLDKSWADGISRLGAALNNVKAANARALASALSALGNTNSTTIFVDQSWIDAITDMANAFDSLDVDKMRAFADAMTALHDMGDIKIPTLSQSLNSLSRSSAGMTFAVSVFRQLGKDIAWVAGKAKDLALAFGRGLINRLLQAASAAGRFAKNIAAAPFNAIASRVKGLTDKLGQLISSFKRIMFYRVIRTVIKEFGEALKEGTENAYWFSKTVGDTTRYISEAYDAFASASAVMKNQVGAAWATLFANIQPLINQIIELVTRAAEVVTMFFAKLGGKSTYLKAIDYGKEWAETTEEGSKAAKEWRNQLMGFDEINRLDALSDENGSSGKNKTPDYSAMFEEVPVESAIGDLADKMKELWQNQKWQELGELIGDTINGLWPDTSQWEEWGSKLGNAIDGAIQTAYYALKRIDFKQFGSDIAAFFNNAIEEIDFEAWGRLLVRKFTAALDFVVSFLGNLHWDAIGEAIGNYFRGALDEGTEWLNSYTWNDLANRLQEKLHQTIDGFDVASFAQSFGTFIVTAANSAADFLDGLDFEDLTDTVINSIVTFFDNVKLDEIKTSIGRLWDSIEEAFKSTMVTFGEWLKGKNEEGAFSKAGSDFNDAILNFLGDLKEMSGAVPWEEIGEAIGDFLKEIKWKEIFIGVWDVVSPAFKEAADWFFGEDGEATRHLAGSVLGLRLAFNGAGAVLSAAAQALVFKMINPLNTIPSGVDTVTATTDTSLGGLVAILRVAAKTVGVAALAVADGILLTYDVKSLKEAADTYNSTQEAINNQVDTTLEGFKHLYETKGPEVAAEYAKMVADIDTTGLSLEESQARIKEKLESEYDDVPKNMWEGFQAGWNDYFGQDGKGLWQLVKDGFSGMVKGVKDLLGMHSPSTVFEDIGKNTIEGLKNGLEEKWSEIQPFFTSTMPSTLSGAWDTIKGAAGTAWDAIKNTVTGSTSDISTESTSDTQTLYNDVTGIYNSLHDEAVRVFSDIDRAVPTIMNHVSDEIKNAVQNMENSMQQLQYSASAAFDTMRANIESAIYAIESIDWSIPAPHIPHITWYYDTVYSDDGSSFNIPQFNVDWYARGGVFDKATLFGMGEAGAEAVVPLERNTEWIGKVAAEMNRQQSAQGGSMAADLEEANDVIVAALYTVSDRIIRAIAENGGEGVDMDALARSISKIQRRQARAMG